MPDEMTPRDWFEQTEFSVGLCRTCGRSAEEVRLERGHVLSAKCHGGQEWFHQCVECNVKQGDLSLDGWSDGGDKGHRNDSDIRVLVDTYQNIQKTRVGLFNAIDAKEKASDTGDLSTLQDVLKDTKADEAKIRRAIGRYVRDLIERDPMARILVQVPGVGPLTTAGILVEIDWSRVNSLDGLYLYAGFAPGADKLVKGQVRRFNRRLKIRFRTWSSGIKMGRNRHPSYAPYGRKYEEWKAISLADPRHADWTAGHHDNDAIRMTAKDFIRHLYIAHLAVHQGINGNREPQAFGWPEFEKA